MIRAIIFDFGRVISAQKPDSLFRRYEIDLGLQARTINTIMFDSRAWQEALVGRRTERQFWHAIGPELGLKTSDAVEGFRRRYRSDETVNQAVVSVLGQLHGRYRLAVLSNSPPGLQAWLDQWALSKLFDVVFCSGDEGVAKPDLLAYRRTLERLGVQAQDAVFVDDTRENILAARDLGMHAIEFTESKELIVGLQRLGVAVEESGSQAGP